MTHDAAAPSARDALRRARAALATIADLNARGEALENGKGPMRMPAEAQAANRELAQQAIEEAFVVVAMFQSLDPYLSFAGPPPHRLSLRWIVAAVVQIVALALLLMTLR